MIESTPEETIAAIHALRAAGSKEMEFSAKYWENKAMKRKMDAGRVIEDRRIDEDE
jgi:hypothetical protein